MKEIAFWMLCNGDKFTYNDKQYVVHEQEVIDPIDNETRKYIFAMPVDNNNFTKLLPHVRVKVDDAWICKIQEGIR